MRLSRIKNEGEGWYHVVSRTAFQLFKFEDADKSIFVNMMRRVAAFSGVEILNFCVMTNHFHILLHVPKPNEITEEILLQRVAALYGNDHAKWLKAQWKALRKRGLLQQVEREQSQIKRRMGDMSEFMKTLKQATSQSFNARLKHAGTMWEARFRVRAVMPDEKVELMKVAGYIDRNPVKAGIVTWPDAYKWCGFAAACAGDVRAQEGYRFIYTFAPVDWPRARKLHEISIGLAIKELEDDPEAKSADGSHGGDRM